MSMESRRIVAVGILSGVQQQTDNLRVPELRRQSQGSMTIFRACGIEQAARVFGAPQSSRHRQINACSPREQSVRGCELAMRAGHGVVGICPVAAKQIDQRYLDAAFARDASRRNQPQGLIERSPVILCARLQNHPGSLHDIRRQLPVPDGILRCKFEQRWILKVAAAFKSHTLMDQVRMRIQVSLEPIHVSGIQ